LKNNNEQISAGQEIAQDADSPARRTIPGFWLATGVFMGNLLFVSTFSGDIAKGVITGAAAGFLVIVVYQFIPGLRANE
jgi:hypothetical protein